MSPEWIPTIAVGVAAVCASGYTVRRVLRHRRRPSNGLWALASAVLFWLTAALYMVGSPSDVTGWIAYPVAAPVLAAPVVLLFAGVALAANTVVVVRREGLRIATLVPLVIGGALLVMLVAGTWWILDVMGALGDSDLGRGAVIVLPLLLIPGSVFLFQLIAYAGYALSYSRLDRVGEADVVVVLGAGLNGNQVTPLLASRLDRRSKNSTPAWTRGGTPRSSSPADKVWTRWSRKPKQCRRTWSVRTSMPTEFSSRISRPQRPRTCSSRSLCCEQRASPGTGWPW